MSLFYDSKEKNEINDINWFTIENFILEYQAISNFIITTNEGLPIISPNIEISEKDSSRIINYIHEYEKNFNTNIDFMEISLGNKTSLIFKKYKIILIMDIAKGSEEMVKRRVQNTLSTYEKFFLSYNNYI